MRWRCTQAEAAKHLGVTQPRFNDLMRGRTHRFNLKALILLAERAGFDVRIDLQRPAQDNGRRLLWPTHRVHTL